MMLIYLIFLVYDYTMTKRLKFKVKNSKSCRPQKLSRGGVGQCTIISSIECLNSYHKIRFIAHKFEHRCVYIQLISIWG